MNIKVNPVFLALVFATITLSGSLNAPVSASKQASTDGFVEINGIKLHYEMKGHGRSVVLIHGGLVDSRMWDDQFNLLAKRYRVVRYDFRGFGQSEFPTQPYSQVEDLYSLLKHLGIEHADLVGLSIGGNIALDFALEHPAMVNSLTLISSSLRGYQYVFNVNRVPIFQAARKGDAENAASGWMDDPIFSSARKYPTTQLRMRLMVAQNLKGWSSIPPNLVSWPRQASIERLNEVVAPTLIVVGSEDISDILGIADVMAEKIKGAQKKLVSGAGHHLNMERPKEFNKILLGFLKNH